jgi:hypothetical protein
MAIQIKAAPFLPNEARHFNGKSVTAVTVSLGVDVTDEFGPNGVIQDVYEVLAENATPIIIGQVKTLATGDFDVYFEGDFTETDDYGTSGTDSFIADLQTRIRALGDTAAIRDAETAAVTGETESSSGVDVEGATVTAISALEAREAGNVGLVGPGGVDVS